MTLEIKEIKYRKGQLARRETYKDGVAEGLWEEWYPNGLVARREIYKDGVPVGLWEGWDENGLLVWRATYKDGLLVSRDTITLGLLSTRGVR